MDKLAKSGAMGTLDGMPTFKRAFADYLVWTLGKREMLNTTLGDWRVILAAFDPSLQELSNEEIMDIVLLFVYHLKHLQIPTIRE
jgi:hypothetical protein